MALQAMKKYYVIKVRPHPEDPERQELDLLPSVVMKDRSGSTISACLHLIWYTNPEYYSLWDFDHMIVTAINFEIFAATPQLLPEIAKINTDAIQPQDFERRLQALDFRRQ